VPFASQRLCEHHPSSTSITSRLSQKRVIYPNDKRVRNTAMRRTADKVKRHVPDYSQVYNGELTSEMLQLCQLRSAMWHLHSQPCVHSEIDLSSTSTSCNMRHTLTNQLTQVISNSNAPCPGPENLVAVFVYFPDSDSLLGSNSTSFSAFKILYMRLLVSPRYDEFVLISNMQFPASFHTVLYSPQYVPYGFHMEWGPHNKNLLTPLWNPWNLVHGFHPESIWNDI
jgi:hypothetical protein